MFDAGANRYRVLGVSPFQTPDPRLARAVTAAGGLGVLDLGTDRSAALRALHRVAADERTRFGVRVPPGCPLTATEVQAVAAPELVLLPAGSPWSPSPSSGSVVTLAEVTDVAAALAASDVDGVVCRGNEAGGPVGELTTFVLLQQVLDAVGGRLPVWACGGIGVHTAHAVAAAGAFGVVLDTQLALLADADVAQQVRTRVRRLDGTETVLHNGHRVLRGDPEFPVGQDAGLAAGFADRFGTARAAVGAVAAALADPVGGVDQQAQGAALRATFGCGLAVAQGPMTRVSDQPEFAAAVAEAGGMPFVALALADGERSTTLLRGTAERLGDRPWGVGILGFAPEALKAEQRAAIRAVRPRCALIAGGTPAQALALEADGVSTYLHVPSPVLLEQFLAAGARRFVFEGAECGGHLGPRSSFALWEAQLAVLERFVADGGDPVQALFAGGVHDARSAAMVAAMAGPLARRGLSVGVLMGTAYLFTDEAVRCGAITAQFQQQALAARSTAILESAPGHRTRCLQTPFVAEFTATAERLRTAAPGERGARLEELNVGRLRIASKGVERVGERLAPVDPAAQLDRGLYMAGQVSVLRDAVTDIATLHRAVTADAADLIGAQAKQPPVFAASRQPEIAIVGMAAVFPGAPDLETFWANVLRGVDAVTEVPPQRWDPAVYHRTEPGPGTTRSRWGGFLAPVPFDPAAFGIPPASLASIDPAQLLSLEISRRALADAGYADRPFDRERTGVIFGAEAGGDLANAQIAGSLLPGYLDAVPPALAAQLPAPTEDSFPGTLANVIAGRVANRLDLGGPNYTVDAACGSSLAALDVACKELAVGDTDTMVCGAVDLHNGIHDYLMFTSAGALSPTGRCRPFDRSADGIALGEGVAALVLRRRADAERDGDRIYAVIRGVGAASDGRSLGLTAPRPEGQRRALRRAYAAAGVAPSAVGLVEAHGTGTVVGDGTELEVLSGFFAEAETPSGSCALGSVKGQIGHTKCAAGMAGLIKSALALWHGVLPPTAQLTDPHPRWDPATSPFRFNTVARPWPGPARHRIAGVSAFGFGGTNFHAVLAAGPTPAPDSHPAARWDAELFLFRGTDDAAALRAVADLHAALPEGGRGADLVALAAVAADRADAAAAEGEPVRFAVVAGDTTELAAALAGLLDGRPVPGCHRADTAVTGRLAFLFPGQGSQRTGMLGTLFSHVAQVREQWAALAPDVLAAALPAAAFTAQAQETQAVALRDTTMAQPALGMVETALATVLGHLGVVPDMAAGHSYGELAALSAAGSFDADTLLRLSVRRAAAIRAAAGTDPGAMAAVTAPAAVVRTVLDEAGLHAVVLANHNAPTQVVVSGPTAAVDRAVEVLRAAGHRAKPLPVACAFHSPVVAAAAEPFEAALAAETVGAPRFPVWSNRTARAYEDTGDGAAVRSGLTGQLADPVRFTELVEDMYAHGARVFAEVGPGSVLGGLVDAILDDRPHTTVTFPPTPGMRGVLDGIARLAVAGVDVRADWLVRGRVPATPPRTPPAWVVDGQTVRRVDGTPVPRALRPAVRIKEEPMPAQSGDTEQAVLEYLRGARELVAAQRDVLLRYLGTAPADQVTLPSALSGPMAAPEATPLALPTAHPTPSLAAPTSVPALTPSGATTLAPSAEPSGASALASSVEPSGASAAAANVGQVGGSVDATVGRPEPSDIAATVRTVISDRTGYPPELIEDDLDLEADLSVDSIKRTEIAGTLIGRLGIGTADTDQDQLSGLRTVHAMTTWLHDHLPGSEPDTASATDLVPESHPTSSLTPETPSGSVAVPETVSVAGAVPHRFVPEMVATPVAPDRPLPTVVTVRCVGAQDELAATVREALATSGTAAHDPANGAGDGATATRAPGESETTAPALVLLVGQAGDEQPAAPRVFGALRTALLEERAATVLVAAPAGDPVSAGLRGLVRSVAREYPDIPTRLVEFDPTDDHAAVAGALLAELQDTTPCPVVRHHRTTRTAATLRAQPPAPRTGSGLDRDAVLLVIGGARGVTALCTTALAAETPCRIELAGRTPHDPDTTPPAATDPKALRAQLAAAGHPIAEIEALARETLARAEVARTMAELRATGAKAGYRTVDARDPSAVRHLVKSVHAEHGRVDGVVFAAGVLDDGLLADKSEDSFRAVFGTKVDGASALLDEMDDLPTPPRFVVFFGSIAAVAGNRGQTDYAAANDAIDTLGTQWAQRTGARLLTVHWGPWAPQPGHPGMVSAELARDYHHRGIGLIDPTAGAHALLQELADGTSGSVVYTVDPW